MDTNAFTDIGGNFIQKIFSGFLWFAVAIIIIGVLGGLMYYFFIYKRKFNITVKVISERSQDKNKILFDKAAILRDKKDGSYFVRLWYLKKDLPAPKFNIFQSTSKGDYFELYRTSENTFYYLTPSNIEKSKILREDGKFYPLASHKQFQMDPNLEFWRVKRKAANKKMFDTEKIWMKLLPYIPHLIGAVVTIFVLYVLMRYLPDVLSQLKALASEMSSSKRAETLIESFVPLALFYKGGFRRKNGKETL